MRNKSLVWCWFIDNLTLIIYLESWQLNVFYSGCFFRTNLVGQKFCVAMYRYPTMIIHLGNMSSYFAKNN